MKKLGIKNSLEWKAYSKSGIRPKNIPGRIDMTFKDQWKGWADFLDKEDYCQISAKKLTNFKLNLIVKKNPSITRRARLD